MIDFACKQFDIREILKCSLGLTKAEMHLFETLAKSKNACTSEALAKKAALDLSTTQRGLKKLAAAGVVLRSQENLAGGGYRFSYALASRTTIRALVLQTLVHECDARSCLELQRLHCTKTRVWRLAYSAQFRAVFAILPRRWGIRVFYCCYMEVNARVAKGASPVDCSPIPSTRAGHRPIRTWQVFLRWESAAKMPNKWEAHATLAFAAASFPQPVSYTGQLLPAREARACL